MKNQSAEALWKEFVAKYPAYRTARPKRIFHFYDTEEAANSAVDRLGQGTKRAYSQALLKLQLEKEEYPHIGSIAIATDWEGHAQYVLQTTSMKFLPLFSIHEEHARLEGEGDKSLKHWRKTQWQIWARQLAKHGRIPKVPMMVVFERFEKLYPH
ncbi:ASCH domain-containing protein [Aureicoccus marinus]|jgi:uncharacterized protein YhfF|uniref:ASCH domain-containing protein n=1 Tax=Aureicoccus marinus TaxID=754435 RepID=A0A2S7T989_9FLAO|nr:ASCH domain-containing protein [Aureicoccus marinus]PQJ16075.1 hypothetical protein BST99_10370 [Aureicoccus marinus]